MTEYKYILKRSRRKSICIKLGADNSIEVTAPLKTTISEIERFVRSKSAWIDRHIKQNSDRQAHLREVLSYEKILINGNAVPFHVGEKNLLNYDFVSVKSLACVKKLFIENLGNHFLDNFYSIKSTYGFTCGRVTFRDYKSRWGSCFRGGDIVFNYRLLMLPRDVQEYVIVHELCHTKEMNHSQKFYAEVARILPDYKLLQRKLKDFSPIVGMY